MKLCQSKVALYLIAAGTIVLIIGASLYMQNYYLGKAVDYIEVAEKRALEQEQNLKKLQSRIWLKQYSAMLEKRFKSIEPQVKEELELKVNYAYELANIIYSKNKRVQSKLLEETIKDLISHLIYNNEKNFIFITDFDGDSILHGSQRMAKENFAIYLDADKRSIILEEIQKVRRNGEGFIQSRIEETKSNELIYVKKLGFYDWFIGSSIVLEEKQKELEAEMIKSLKNMPLPKDHFIAIYKDTKLICNTSSNSKALQNNHNQLSIEYFKPFDWYILYGYED